VTPILETVALTKHFGGITAVDNCSLTVEAGTITALIGPNGSGKTTAFNLITGYLPADRGQVLLDGRAVRPRPASMVRHGLCRTFQQARVFSEMTVRENMVVASRPAWQSLLGRRVNAADRLRSTELLDEFNLGDKADSLAADLSYGQRKLLEFAAVLMAQPRLVLLDEPSAGVNPIIIEAMERHIRDRHAGGVTFLVVEHDMGLVMRLCDPVIVLDRGTPILTGPPAVVQDDPKVLDAYLGA
jgi:ABC-type branched-subunit amino acid transport system ATPase component